MYRLKCSVYLLAVILLGVCLAILWLPTRYEHVVVLDYWPKFDDNNSENTLIHLRRGDPGNARLWANKIDKFFHDYQGNHVDAGFRAQCSAYDHELRGDYVCDVHTMTRGPCSSGKHYGYSRGTPCVFLQLSQNDWWAPEPYNDTDHLPDDMPDELKEYISEEIKKTRGSLEANMVWVSCEGENALDIEHIGRMYYVPQHGLPAYYFPSSGKPGYLSPYVAVYFAEPTRGVVISVVCRAWARNIQYDRYSRRGSVRFQILVD